MLLQQKLLAAGISLICLWVSLVGLGAGATAAELDPSSVVEPEAATTEEGIAPSIHQDESEEIFRLLNEGFKLRIEGSVDSLKQAAELCEQALFLAKDSDIYRQEMLDSSCLGLVYHIQSEQETALEYLQQSLSLSQAMGDHTGEADITYNTGIIYSSQGKYPEALDYFEQGLRLYREIGTIRGEANVLRNIGVIYANQGRDTDALAYLQRSLETYRSLGDRESEAIALKSIEALEAL